MQATVQEKTKEQEEQKAEYDDPWKYALDHFFQSFMEFCLPEIAANIDWSRGYVSLDKEFNKVMRAQKKGKRLVDKLFQVWLKGGKKVWLLFHIEVEVKGKNNFEKRMYVYNYRIFDYYEMPVSSIAILADDNPNWRPHQYESDSYCSKVHFQFTSIKLLDYYTPEPPPISNANPFAIIIWAHLQTLKTKKKPKQRFQAKLTIARALYKHGFDKEYIRNLYQFIDWVMALPESLEIEYNDHLEQLEEETHMAYVSTSERVYTNRGIQQGRQEGRQEGEAAIILRQIKRRFGALPDSYAQQITEADAETLLVWGDRILDAKTLEDIFNV